MNLVGLLLGIINIAIVVAILLLIGAIVAWFCNRMTLTVPQEVRTGYIVVVGLIALYMLVALLVGMPTLHIVNGPGVLGG
jgi:hypothetical protein